jgi:methionine-gamma-lyase
MNIENQVQDMLSAAMHANDHHNAEHAHLAPIYASSTFTFESAEQGMNRFTQKEPGFIYSRFGNPTTSQAAAIIANLEAFGLLDEQGSPLQLKAILHASGQAAMATMLLCNLAAGDSVLSHHSLYGGTHEFMLNMGYKVILPILPMLGNWKYLSKKLLR